MSDPGNEAKKLGELLVESGLIPADKLPEGLEYARANKLPLGRVLLTWHLLKKEDLESALHSQALIKVDQLPAAIAAKAIALSSRENISIDRALKRLGWQPDKFVQGEPHSLAIAREEVNTARAAFGPSHPETAMALLNYADTCAEEEHAEEAETAYKKTISIVEQCFGTQSPEMAAVLPKLAELYFTQDRFKESEQYFWRTYEIKQALLGDDAMEVAECLQSLAELYEVQSEYLQAERYYLASIGIKERILEADDPELLESLKKLVLVCKQREKRPEEKVTGEVIVDAGLLTREKIDEALELAKKYNIPIGRTLVSMRQLAEDDLQRVLHARMLMLDGALPASVVIRALKWASKQGTSVEQALRAMGWKKEDTAEQKQLERLLKSSEELVRLEKALTPDHTDVGIKCIELADLYAGANNCREAEILLGRALRIFRDNLSDSDMITANTLVNLSDILIRQGKLAEAETNLSEALSITESVLGKASNRTAEVLQQLGRLKLIATDYAGALECYRRSRDICEMNSSSADAGGLSNLHELEGDCLAQLRDHKGAIESYERALVLREKSMISSGNPQITGIENKIGLLYMSIGDAVSAIKHYERAVELTEKAVGAVHPSIAFALLNLADASVAMKDHEQASQHYRRAVIIIEQISGPVHEDTAKVLERYMQFLNDTGMTEEATRIDRRIREIRTGSGPRATVVQLRPVIRRDR
ncbi:MAG: tetratricopeptide repeat protein [Candidatus Obscuribacterales bacterium]|nr:tetratricopeptide repeat protein [Candidatus Obscuribacterales bacterium]